MPRTLILPMLAAALLAGHPAAASERAMQTASGTFTVKMLPKPAGAASMARFELQKGYTGDLVGNSSGLMLSAGDPGKGEAGYVALETVTGSLSGRSGGMTIRIADGVHHFVLHYDLPSPP